MIAVGRLRPPFQDDVEHYRKLLAGHARVELIEVREDEKVPPRIPERAHLVLLATDGREFDSIELSEWLEERRQEGRDLCFVIGGPRGLDLERLRHAAVARPHHAAAPARPRGAARAALPGPQDPRSRAVSLLVGAWIPSPS